MRVKIKQPADVTPGTALTCPHHRPVHPSMHPSMAPLSIHPGLSRRAGAGGSGPEGLSWRAWARGSGANVGGSKGGRGGGGSCLGGGRRGSSPLGEGREEGKGSHGGGG